MRRACRPGGRPLQRIGIPLGLLALLAACSSAPRPAPPAAEPRPGTAPERTRRTLPAADPLAARLVERARALLDSPYRYSGGDPRGFDCSGLTRYVFAAVGVGLPRTTEEQARVGRWVALDELRRGDLVFFGPTRDKPSHVGMVVSAPGEPLAMIHASTSRGVIETRILGDSYWLTRLRFGRRVLPAG